MSETTCDWEGCPGYSTLVEPLQQREDGAWHTSCLAEYSSAEALRWYETHAPALVRRPLHVSEVVDEVFESADDLRAARRVS